MGILFSATAYFADRDAALACGFTIDEIRMPRRDEHAAVHLEHCAIEEDDWRVRQARLDEALARAIRRAEPHLAYSPDVELVLRLGLDSEAMMSFMLPNDLLRAWSALGGAIAVDA
jgi:hypothetical protein